MELLFRVSLCLLTFIGKTFGDEIGIKIYCKEDEDVILPCSFEETLTDKPFDWKKDGKDVFLCVDGKMSSSSQDEQFRGRVTHFPDELNSGNASIRIKKAKVSDSGTYICLNIVSAKSHKIELTVVCTLKDRTNDPEKKCGTCPKPTISTHNQENGGTQVECAVHGAYPEPKMELQNSAYVMVKAENTKISQNGRYFDIILEAVVTKKDYYHCAVTQEEICHQIYSQKTMVHIPYGSSNATVIGLVVALVALVALGVIGFILYKKKHSDNAGSSPGDRTKDNTGSEGAPLHH